MLDKLFDSKVVKILFIAFIIFVIAKVIIILYLVLRKEPLSLLTKTFIIITSVVITCEVYRQSRKFLRQRNDTRH